MKTRCLQAAWILMLYAVTILAAAQSSGKCKISNDKTKDAAQKTIHFKTEENLDTLSTQGIKYSPEQNTEDCRNNNPSKIVDEKAHEKNIDLRYKRNVDKYRASEKYYFKRGSNSRHDDNNMRHDDTINMEYFDISNKVNYNPTDNSYNLLIPSEVEKLDDSQNDLLFEPTNQVRECEFDTSNKFYELNPPLIVEFSEPIDDIKLNFDDAYTSQISAHVGNNFDLAQNNVYKNEECTCDNEERRRSDNIFIDPIFQTLESGYKQNDNSKKLYIFEIQPEDLKSADKELNPDSIVSCDCHYLHKPNANDAMAHTLDDTERLGDIDETNKCSLSTPNGNIELGNEPIDKMDPFNLDSHTTFLGINNNFIDKIGTDYTDADHICSENVRVKNVNVDVNKIKNEKPDTKTIKNSVSGHSNTYNNYLTLQKYFFDPATNSYVFNISQNMEDILPSAELCSRYDNHLGRSETERYPSSQENKIDFSDVANENHLKVPIDITSIGCKDLNANSDNFNILSKTSEPYKDKGSFINIQDHSKHFEVENEICPSIKILSKSHADEINLNDNLGLCKNKSLNNYSFFDDPNIQGRATGIADSLLYDCDEIKRTKEPYLQMSVVPSEDISFTSNYKSYVKSELSQNLCECDSIKSDNSFNTDMSLNHLKPENYICDKTALENARNDAETSKISEKSGFPIPEPILTSKKGDSEDNLSNPPICKQVQNNVKPLQKPTIKTDSNLDRFENKLKLPSSYIQESFETPVDCEITKPCISQVNENPYFRNGYLNNNLFDECLNNYQQNPEFIVTNPLDPTFSCRKVENAFNQKPFATMHCNVANNDDFKLSLAKFPGYSKFSNILDHSTNVPTPFKKSSTEGTAVPFPSKSVINNAFASIYNLNSQQNLYKVKSNKIEPSYNVKDAFNTKINEDPYIARVVHNLNLPPLSDSHNCKNIRTINSKNSNFNSINGHGYNAHNVQEILSKTQSSNPILTDKSGFPKVLPINLKSYYVLPYLTTPFSTSSLPPATNASCFSLRKNSNNILLNEIGYITPITSKVSNVLNPNTPKILSLRNEPLSSIIPVNETSMAVTKSKLPSIYSIQPSKNMPFLTFSTSYQTPPLSLYAVSQNKPFFSNTDLPTTTLPSKSVPLVGPQTSKIMQFTSNHIPTSIPSRTSKQSILSTAPNTVVTFSTEPDRDFSENLEPFSIHSKQYVPYADSKQAFSALASKPPDVLHTNPLEATARITPSHIYRSPSHKPFKIPSNTFDLQLTSKSVPILPYSDSSPLINQQQLSFRKENTVPLILFRTLGNEIPQKFNSRIPGSASPINANGITKGIPLSSISDTSIPKSAFSNVNICPKRDLKGKDSSNLYNRDISLTEAKRTRACSPATSILSNNNFNVCPANAIFFSSNPCKCNFFSAESLLLPNPVKATTSLTSTTCSDKPALATTEPPKLDTVFKSNNDACLNTNTISEQLTNFSPTNPNFVRPIHDATIIPISDNIFDGKKFDSNSMPESKTSLPQHISTIQPLQPFDNSVPIKKSLTNPNINTDIPSKLPFSKSHANPLSTTILTRPNTIISSPIPLLSASNVHKVELTDVPTVYNPITKHTDLPTYLSLIPTVLRPTSFKTPSSSLSPLLMNPVLLNPNDAYYKKPIIASYTDNTNPIKLATHLNPHLSPNFSPVTVYPYPASTFLKPNRRYSNLWSTSNCLHSQVASVSTNIFDFMMTSIKKSVKSAVKPVITDPVDIALSPTLNNYHNTKAILTKVHPELKPVAFSYYTDKRLVPASLTNCLEIRPVPVNFYSDITANPISVRDPVTQVHDTNYPSKSSTLAFYDSTPVPTNSNSYTTVTNHGNGLITNISNIKPVSLLSYPEPNRSNRNAYAPISVDKLNNISINFATKTVPSNRYPYMMSHPINKYSDSKLLPTIQVPSETPVDVGNSLFVAPISAEAHPSAITIPVNTYQSTKNIPTCVAFHTRINLKDIPIYETNNPTKIPAFPSTYSSVITDPVHSFPNAKNIFANLNPKEISICDTDNSSANLDSPSAYHVNTPKSLNNFPKVKTVPTSEGSYVTKVFDMNVSPYINIPMNVYQKIQRVPANVSPSVPSILLNNYKNVSHVHNRKPFLANTGPNIIRKIAPANITPTRIPNYPFASPIRPSKYLNRNKVPPATTPTPANTFLSYSNTKYNLNNIYGSISDTSYSSKIAFIPSKPLKSYNTLKGAKITASSPISNLNESPYMLFSSKLKPTKFNYKRSNEPYLCSTNLLKYKTTLTKAPIEHTTPILTPNVLTSILEPVSLANVKSLNSMHSPQAAFNVLNPFRCFTYSTKLTAAKSNTPRIHSSNTSRPIKIYANKLYHTLKKSSVLDYSNIKHLTSSSFMKPELLPFDEELPYFKMSPHKFFTDSSFKNIAIPTHLKPNVINSLSPDKTFNNVLTNSGSSSCITPANKINSMPSISSMYPFTLSTPYTAVRKSTVSSPNLLPESIISCAAAIPNSSNIAIEKPISNSCRLNQNKPCDYIPKATHTDAITLMSQNTLPISLPDTFNNGFSSPAMTAHSTTPCIDTLTFNPCNGLTTLATGTITSSKPYDDNEKINTYKTSFISTTSYSKPIYSSMASADQRKMLSSNSIHNFYFAPLKYYTPNQISMLLSQPCSTTRAAPFSIINSSSKPVSPFIVSDSSPGYFPLYQSIYTPTLNVGPNKPLSPTANTYSNLSPLGQSALLTLNNIANLNYELMPSPSCPMPIVRPQVSLPGSQIFNRMPNSFAYEYKKPFSTATPSSMSPLYYPAHLYSAKNMNTFENVQNPHIDQRSNYFSPSLNKGNDNVNYNGLSFAAPKYNPYQTLQRVCPNCQHLSNLLETNINKIVTPKMLKNLDTQNSTVLVKNLGFIKYFSNVGEEFRVKTSIPGIELKAWPSQITVFKPKIVIEATKYKVLNFLPVVSHNKFDKSVVQNIA